MEVLQKNGFVCLFDVDSSISQSVRYATTENCLGRIVDGYEAEKIIIKRAAAIRLKDVHSFLTSYGYTLVVYDAYRPRRAVKCFIEWSSDPDVSKKDSYYPHFSKSELFLYGYIADNSQHCNGYTVDLTLMKIGERVRQVVVSQRTMRNGEKVQFLDDGTVDMGTSFDCFHSASNYGSKLISEQATENRKVLRDTMIRFGFMPCEEEWWHFTLTDGEENNGYDFPVR